MTYVETINYPNAPAWPNWRPAEIEIWTGCGGDYKRREARDIPNAIVVDASDNFSRIKRIIDDNPDKEFTTFVILQLSRSRRSDNLLHRLDNWRNQVSGSAGTFDFHGHEITRVILEFDTPVLPWHPSYKPSRLWNREHRLVRYRRYIHRAYENESGYAMAMHNAAVKRDAREKRKLDAAEAKEERRKKFKAMKAECEARDQPCKEEYFN